MVMGRLGGGRMEIPGLDQRGFRCSSPASFTTDGAPAGTLGGEGVQGGGGFLPSVHRHGLHALIVRSGAQGRGRVTHAEELLSRGGAGV